MYKNYKLKDGIVGGGGRITFNHNQKDKILEIILTRNMVELLEKNFHKRRVELRKAYQLLPRTQNHKYSISHLMWSQ